MALAQFGRRHRSDLHLGPELFDACLVLLDRRAVLLDRGGYFGDADLVVTAFGPEFLLLGPQPLVLDPEVLRIAGEPSDFLAGRIAVYDDVQTQVFFFESLSHDGYLFSSSARIRVATLAVKSLARR